MATEIRHDAFARFSVVRERLPYNNAECASCGQRARFMYGTVSDGDLRGRIGWAQGRFCSIGCARSYGLSI